MLERPLRAIPGRKTYGRWHARLTELARYARRRANKNGLEYTLTVEHLTALVAAQDYCCARTGILFFIDDRHPSPGAQSAGTPSAWGPSIDRLDRTQGYTPDNIQLVCWMYNSCKHAADDVDVMIFAQALINEHRRRATGVTRERPTTPAEPRS